MKKTLLLATAATMLATSALAGSPGYAVAQPVVHSPVTPAFSWAGAYAGMSLGYGGSNYALSGSYSEPPLSASLRLPDLGGQGGLLGLQLGYNFVVGDRMVLGVQVDATGTRIRNRTGLELTVPPDSLSASYTLTPRTMFTLAGRAGYLATPDTMVYGLLGYTRGNFGGDLNATINGASVFDSSYDFRLNGAAFGVGIETRLTDNVTLGLEYRYNRFRRYSFYDGPAFSGTDLLEVGFNTSVQTVRLALNFHF